MTAWSHQWYINWQLMRDKLATTMNSFIHSITGISGSGDDDLELGRYFGVAKWRGMPESLSLRRRQTSTPSLARRKRQQRTLLPLPGTTTTALIVCDYRIWFYKPHMLIGSTYVAPRKMWISSCLRCLLRRQKSHLHIAVIDKVDLAALKFHSVTLKN